MPRAPVHLSIPVVARRTRPRPRAALAQAQFTLLQAGGVNMAEE